LILACLHFELGEPDEGFRYLEESAKKPCMDLRRARGWPLPSHVLEDPRFSAWLKQIGIPPHDLLK
jgi:hypothetical protein